MLTPRLEGFLTRSGIDTLLDLFARRLAKARSPATEGPRQGPTVVVFPPAHGRRNR